MCVYFRAFKFPINKKKQKAIDVAINQTNYQFTSVIVIHFMNSATVGWINKRTVFNVCTCLNLN